MKSIFGRILTVGLMGMTMGCNSHVDIEQQVDDIRPIQLQGFARVNLQPGEQNIISQRYYNI